MVPNGGGHPPPSRRHEVRAGKPLGLCIVLLRRGHRFEVDRAGIGAIRRATLGHVLTDRLEAHGGSPVPSRPARDGVGPDGGRSGRAEGVLFPALVALDRPRPGGVCNRCLGRFRKRDTGLLATSIFVSTGGRQVE